MRRPAVLAATLLLAAAVTGRSTGATTTWTHGYDVSWPQCHGSAARHLPGGSPAYVVLGLTDGRGHTANPCFADQVVWARSVGARIAVYLVPTFPRRGGDDSALQADGAAQADDALGVMRSGGVTAPMVWVDVETRDAQPWSHSPARNRQVLVGVLHALAAAHVRAGIYTTGSMWREITGGWRLWLPNWIPAGYASWTTAKGRCHASATGGTVWLAQYTHEWDNDTTCPAMDVRRGHPGPLWPYRNTTLLLGNTGRAVTALQHALKIDATGTYDLATTVAVTEFQAGHGLAPTGVTDSEVWRALGAFKWIGAHGFLLWAMTTR